MKRSAGHAMLMAKHPLFRKIWYGLLAVIFGIVGWAGALELYSDYQKNHRPATRPLVILLALLPFIIVGGEVYRYFDGAGKIRCVRCLKCVKESPLKAVYKIGNCPHCETKKLTGILFTGGHT